MTLTDLTNNQIKEFTYSASKPELKHGCLYNISVMLNKAGINTPITDVYTEEFSEAVKKFQKEQTGLKPTGTLDNSTYAWLVTRSNQKAPDTIQAAEEGGSYDVSDNSGNNDINPHYSSYFDEENTKTFRQNRKNIKIVLGSGTITKTIIGVFLRSQTIEFDTSGNPISEIYEFVARDIKESDESADGTKYTAAEPNTAPSDIQYNFNF